MDEGTQLARLLASGRFPSVARAREISAGRLAVARETLGGGRNGRLDVVAFGSLARGEMTSESDFDYLVLAGELPNSPHATIDLLKRADDLRREWGTAEGHDVRQPGASGLFGTAVGAFEMIDQIGLQADTNHSLTRRMLLLEESSSLMDSGVHAAVVRAALKRYLQVGPQPANDPGKAPRFLLNDVVRYWRTLSVDYQAKARDGEDASGLRYLKLVISRKVVFAGTLMSLVTCGLDGWHRATVDDLQAQFAMTPLERLAQGYERFGDQGREAIEGVVNVMDYFLEASGNATWRHAVRRGRSGDRTVEQFDQARKEARRLQGHLETLFFGEDLRSRSQSLLVF